MARRRWVRLLERFFSQKFPSLRMGLLTPRDRIHVGDLVLRDLLDAFDNEILRNLWNERMNE